MTESIQIMNNFTRMDKVRLNSANYMQIFDTMTNTGEPLLHYLLSVMPTSTACSDCKMKVLSLLMTYFRDKECSRQKQACQAQQRKERRAQAEDAGDHLQLKQQLLANLLHCLAMETLQTCGSTNLDTPIQQAQPAGSRQTRKRCASPLLVEQALLERAKTALSAPPPSKHTRQ
jgi:hypothetical protein